MHLIFFPLLNTISYWNLLAVNFSLLLSIIVVYLTFSWAEIGNSKIMWHKGLGCSQQSEFWSQCCLFQECGWQCIPMQLLENIYDEAGFHTHFPGWKNKHLWKQFPLLKFPIQWPINCLYNERGERIWVQFSSLCPPPKTNDWYSQQSVEWVYVILKERMSDGSHKLGWGHVQETYYIVVWPRNYCMPVGGHFKWLGYHTLGANIGAVIVD